ncbi:MAG: MBL fold metallo-hydrolase [Spirochaetales bacterium]|nr:MBL fold metallo-hydrolase [Spirochaetales bacterium]
MKIRWLGHAAFLLKGDNLRIITDPYDPDVTNLKPIVESADVVLRSSGDDRAHCFVDTIPPGYRLLTATDYIEPGKDCEKVGNTNFFFMPSRESLIHKEVPRDNAFYRFELEGIRIAHLGDVGNRLSDNQLSFLRGTDILLALTGGPPTISLDDLMYAIGIINPKVIIPMHFRIPGPTFSMFPIERFIKYFEDKRVVRVGSPEIDFTKPNLPDETKVFILDPAKKPR